MSEILTSIAQPMRYLIELDTPLVLKKNIGMLMEGDVEANTVVLEVFKTRNVPADLSGITFCLYFTRPDGNTLKPIEGTVEENTVRLTLTGGCYKYTGQYTMLVTMKKGEENRTVLKATGHMEGRNTENMIDPEGTFPTPEELLEMLNMLDEALQSANTATENATAAATRANNAAAGIETVTATATELEPNEEATAQVIKGESGMHFAFGIPRGEKGEKGEKGDPGTAENVTIDSVAGLREALNKKQPKGDYLPADGTAADASKLGGKLPEEYLAADGTAADANKLGGKMPEAYATKEDLENIDVGQLKEEVSQLKDEKINYTDALTLEEIEASTDLTKKVVSASIFEYRSQKLANGADYESVILENFNTLICRSGNVCTLSITVDANYNNSNDDWVYPFVLPDWATPKNRILFDTIARKGDVIKYWNFAILDDGRIRCYASKDTTKWRVTLSLTYVV